MDLEYNLLFSRLALALLKSPIPLANAFKKWDSWEEIHHMKNIWNTAEARAKEVVRANFIDAMKDAR